ncbi:MAG: hypothetical protein KC431_14700 [Myxococcales bacterium]|nr:hypothetical protein [Myxococcales bacterium]
MSAEATIERFIAFVAGFVPGYAETIAGADPDELERLEEILATQGLAPLPPLLRAM